MKLLKNLVLLLIMTGNLFAGSLYQVTDSSGNVILESDDSVLVQSLKNVIVKEISDTVKLIELPNKKTADEIFMILKKNLGNPEHVVYEYRWEVGEQKSRKVISVIKQHKTAFVKTNYSGRKLLKKYFILE